MGNEQQKVSSKVDINPTISVINFNINGLNTPIKRQRLPECIKNTGLNDLLCTRNPLNMKTKVD